MRRLYVWVHIVWRALRWMPKLNLGDRVLYEGKEWSLIQGVASPYWDMWNGITRINHIHKSELHKVRTLRNYLGSFRSGYCFFMVCWYSIWVYDISKMSCKPKAT